MEDDLRRDWQVRVHGKIDLPGEIMCLILYAVSTCVFLTAVFTCQVFKASTAIPRYRYNRHPQGGTQ